MVLGLLLLCCVVGCGSSAPTPSASGGSESTAPVTGSTEAQHRFGQLLDRRCSRSVSSLKRISTPRTLPEQAAYSRAQSRILGQLLAGISHLAAPPSAADVRSLRRALASAVKDDGYIVDAANSRSGEGVAYWIDRQADARRSFDTAATELAAISCRL
jgi:hypothetical protein